MRHHPDKVQNFITVIGRIHDGDDQDVIHYKNRTVAQACHQFRVDVRHDQGIRETDVVAGYEFTNVYIEHVLVSDSPITWHMEQ